MMIKITSMHSLEIPYYSIRRHSPRELRLKIHRQFLWQSLLPLLLRTDSDGHFPSIGGCAFPSSSYVVAVGIFVVRIYFSFAAYFYHRGWVAVFYSAAESDWAGCTVAWLEHRDGTCRRDRRRDAGMLMEDRFIDGQGG